jgi:hypothetical protein
MLKSLKIIKLLGCMLSLMLLWGCSDDDPKTDDQSTDTNDVTDTSSQGDDTQTSDTESGTDDTENGQIGSDPRRIRVEGNKFYVGDKPIFMLGANTPWDRWNDFGHRFNYDYWDQEFQKLHDHGLNNTRVWISCSGENDSPGIDENGYISEPTEQFWSDVAQLFEVAEKHGIYLMIALISFDHTKDQRNFEYWRNMYASADNRQSFVDNYVVPFLEHFGDNPYFWSIDVGNELVWVFENHDALIDDVLDLVARVANAVHENSEVLVTQGAGAGGKYLSPTIGQYGNNFYSDEYLSALQPGAYLDFYKIHHYDWILEWFSSPFIEGTEAYGIDDKPAIIGEYSGVGHGEGFSPAECLEKAVALGWQGLQPWTSNGVDEHGSIDDFGPAFHTWSDANYELIFPND